MHMSSGAARPTNRLTRVLLPIDKIIVIKVLNIHIHKLYVYSLHIHTHRNRP